MPYKFPNHKAGDVINIAGVGKVTVQVPMGSPNPFPIEPAPKPSDLILTHQSALHGHKHGDFFEQGNDASNIHSGAVYVDDSGISGLELRFFGRKVITTGEAKGERHEFCLKDEEHISGVHGTYNDSHLTSLTLLTTKDRRLEFGIAHALHTAFSWIASATQIVVGLCGFAGDMIHGLSVIFTDSQDDPPYNPAVDGTIESLSSRDIVGPKMQQLLRSGDYTELAKQLDTQTKNINSLYGTITEIVTDGLNPWAVVVDDLGMRLYTHYDISTTTAVYIQTDAPEVPDPSKDVCNVTIGTASGSDGWTTSNTINTFLGGAAGVGLTIAILNGFSKFFEDWVLSPISRFIGNALEKLAARFAQSGVLRGAARMWAAQAGRIVGGTAKWGLRIMGPLLGALFAYGIQALLDWIFKSYYISVRIYNHDSDAVQWTPISYYGDNEMIPGADWEVVSIPTIEGVYTTKWIPGIGKVTRFDWVGAYNSYVFENDAAAGVAVAMAVQKGSGPEGLMCLYRVPKGPDNSMALSWGLQDPKSYLNNASTSKVKDLSIGSPTKVLMTTPALTGASQGFYSCSIFIGTFPPIPT